MKFATVAVILVAAILAAFSTLGGPTVSSTAWPITWPTLWAAELSGEGWRGSRGWGMDSPYQGKYSADRMVMVSGVVSGFEKVVPLKGMSPGIAVKIKTLKETVAVHLGPLWYLERLEYRISTGDKLEIKGARTSFKDHEAVMAAEVRNANRFLILRDNDGVPVWAGWGWKRQALSPGAR